MGGQSRKLNAGCDARLSYQMPLAKHVAETLCLDVKAQEGHP